MDSLLIELAVRDDPETVEVRTDVDGRFVLGGLSHERHMLYVDSVRFEPTRLADVDVGRRDVSLVVQLQALLELTVLDIDTGRPVAGADVTAHRLTGTIRGIPLDVVPRGRGVFDVVGVQAPWALGCMSSLLTGR